ncbi:MAG: SIR2 family protein [Nitrospirae bacterium]|nr:SIR2 family protein [Nitrospirota bacterium]
MFDKRLIRIINSGRCFALVGSGPSCEVGYPSWQRLADLTYAELESKGSVSDSQSYKKYLADKKYAEFFRQAERDLGSRSILVNLVKSLLTPAVKNQGVLYELISNWPFACYLTTNYDDEIRSYLLRLNEHFTVVRNRKEDFYYLRDGASRVIQKLHSDLDYPDEVVLTSADYQLFYSDYSGRYFSDKLRQAFETFDIFIIGHSLSDPDIELVLKIARNTASPQHPIYMAAADFTKADEQEYLEKYNIVLVQYSNSDGTHSELRRMLKGADKYIVSRQRHRERSEPAARPKEEIESAIALFLYRRLQGVQATDYLSPLILAGLLLEDDRGIVVEKVASMPALQKFIKGGTNSEKAIKEELETLIQQGLVSNVAEKLTITESGRAKVKEYQAIREIEKDQAYGQFRLNLNNNYDGFTDLQLEQCQNLAEEVIVTTFANRGLTIANQVFSAQTASSGELSDIFGFVSDNAAEIENMAIRAAFVEAMHQFLVEPTHPQREYLESVSQGYFLYHLLGLDPKCGRVRQNIFQRTLWLCDSSVLLPLAAHGCYNHDYAVELFQTLSDANARIYTTPKLLREAWEHFDWAFSFIKKPGAKSLEFLRAALVKSSYKQNLFLDGYIRLSADGRVGTFKDYLSLLPRWITDRSSFDKSITSGILVINISDLQGFVQDDWGEIEEANAKIKDERLRRGSYRSQLQVETEGEVWTLVKNLRSGKYLLRGASNVRSFPSCMSCESISLAILNCRIIIAPSNNRRMGEH